MKQFAPAGDPSYESCWHTLTEAHAPMLKRTDTAMESSGQAPGHWCSLATTCRERRPPLSSWTNRVSRRLEAACRPPWSAAIRPAGSFRSGTRQSSSAPTTFVQLIRRISRSADLAGHVCQATSNGPTPSRRPRAVKSVTTQWVVFTGLKKHGFPGDTAVLISRSRISPRPQA